MNQNNNGGWGAPPPNQQPQQPPQQPPQQQQQQQPQQQWGGPQQPQQQWGGPQQPQQQWGGPQQPQQQPPPGWGGGGQQQPPQGQMPAGAPDPMQGVGDAQNNEGGNPIRPGAHLLQIKGPKYFYSHGSSSWALVIEYTVRATSNVAAMPVGSDTSDFMAMKYASTKSNIRRLVAAAYGIPFEQVTDDRARSILHESNPTAGGFVYCDAHLIMTEKNKRPFTKKKYRHVSAEEAQTVANQIESGELMPTPSDPQAVALERQEAFAGQAPMPQQHAGAYGAQTSYPPQGQQPQQQWGGPQGGQGPQQQQQPAYPPPGPQGGQGGWGGPQGGQGY